MDFQRRNSRFPSGRTRRRGDAPRCNARRHAASCERSRGRRSAPRILASIADVEWNSARAGAPRAAPSGSRTPTLGAATTTALARDRVVRTKLAQVRLDEHQGRLIDAEEAGRAQFEIARLVRRMNGLPDRLADELPSRMTPIACARSGARDHGPHAQASRAAAEGPSRDGGKDAGRPTPPDCFGRRAAGSCRTTRSRSARIARTSSSTVPRQRAQSVPLSPCALTREVLEALPRSPVQRVVGMKGASRVDDGGAAFIS
jgi:hypothetical protein